MTDTSKRLEEIVKMREQGKTLCEIGEHFGISSERVRQIIKKHTETVSVPFEGKLSTRTWHALCRTGIENKEQLEKALENGICVQNIGKEGAKEIAEYIERKIVFDGRETIHGITCIYKKRRLKYE